MQTFLLILALMMLDDGTVATLKYKIPMPSMEECQHTKHQKEFTRPAYGDAETYFCVQE